MRRHHTGRKPVIGSDPEKAVWQLMMLESGDLLLCVPTIFSFRVRKQRIPLYAGIRLRQLFWLPQLFYSARNQIRLYPPYSPLYAINVVDCPRPRAERLSIDRALIDANRLCILICFKAPESLRGFKYGPRRCPRYGMPLRRPCGNRGERLRDEDEQAVRSHPGRALLFPQTPSPGCGFFSVPPAKTAGKNFQAHR